MAPEIFEGKSYGYQVDGWAAGCFSVFIAWYTILGLTQDREEIVCKNVSLKR
jgi:serine/threonine protein kinase